MVGTFGSRPGPFLRIGLVALVWAGEGLLRGKGYCQGGPAGGYPRLEDPFNFWLPTLLLLGIRVCMILILLGVMHLPSR